MSVDKERLARVETKVDLLTEKVDEFIKSADQRYASKTSEKIVYGMVGIVLTAVLTALIGLVVVKTTTPTTHIAGSATSQSK